MFLIAPDGGKDALSLRMPWLVVIADLHLHVFFLFFCFFKNKRLKSLFYKITVFVRLEPKTKSFCLPSANLVYHRSQTMGVKT